MIDRGLRSGFANSVVANSRINRSRATPYLQFATATKCPKWLKDRNGLSDQPIRWIEEFSKVLEASLRYGSPEYSETVINGDLQ